MFVFAGDLISENMWIAALTVYIYKTDHTAAHCIIEIEICFVFRVER